LQQESASRTVRFSAQERRVKPIEVRKNEVITGGTTGESVDFSIKIDGGIFKTLIDGMYSEKVPSVVREILANAFDAHVAANNTVDPVTVSLPTMFNRTFRVRDYGVGMSHDFIIKLYTQLGHSEKKGTNTQTGRFGLGSKTPFTIVDQFTIRAYDGKTMRVYQAVIKDDGIPSLSLQTTVASTAKTGIEIQIGVSSAQVGEFESAIRSNGLTYFDKHVVFNREFSDGTKVMDTVRDSVRKLTDGLYAHRNADGRRYRSGRILIRQGFAVYPLKMDMLSRAASPIPAAYGKYLTKLSNNDTDIMIDVPMGTFNMTAAREKIQYDTPSVNNLAVAVSTILEESFTGLRALTVGVTSYRELYSKVEATLVGPAMRAGSKELRTETQSHANLVQDHVEVNWKNLKTAKVPQPSWSHLLSEGAVSSTAKFYTATADFMADYVSTGLQTDTVLKSMDDDDTTPPNLEVGGYIGNSVKVVRQEQITLGIHDFVFVIPHSVKHWQDRVYLTVAKQLFKECGPQGAQRVPTSFYVVRTTLGQVDDAVRAVRANNSVTGQIFLAADLAEYVPSAVLDNTLTRVRSYSRSSVYKFRPNSGYGGGFTWDTVKFEADPTLPAYYVVRKGIGPRVTLCAPAKIAEVSARMDGASYVTNSGAASFVPLETCENGQLSGLVVQALQLGLLDKDIPIYRLTERQGATVGDVAPAWMSLGSLLADAAIPLYKTNVVDTISARQIHADTGSDLVTTLLDEFIDVQRATAKMTNPDFIKLAAAFPDQAARLVPDIKKDLMKETHVYGLNALPGVCALIQRSDALAIRVLADFNRLAPTQLTRDLQEVRKQAHTVMSLMNSVFNRFPKEKDFADSSKKANICENVAHHFALLEALHGDSNLVGEHLNIYLTAVAGSATVQAVMLNDHPQLQPLVTDMRKFLFETMVEWETALSKYATPTSHNPGVSA
jgi:hypothetical protein